MKKAIIPQTVETGHLDTPLVHEVQGFDGSTYAVRVEVGRLSVAQTKGRPAKLDLSPAQLLVAHFALKNTGQPFGCSDTTLPKNVFNEAVLDRAHGLSPFFDGVAGPQGLWYKDYRTHQLGLGDEVEEQTDRQPTLDTLDGACDNELGPLTDDQRQVAAALRRLVPGGGIELDTLLDLLIVSLPQYADLKPELEAALSGVIHRVRNNRGRGSFDIKECSRRDRPNLTKVFMDPALSITEPPAIDTAVQSTTTTEEPQRRARSRRPTTRRANISEEVPIIAGIRRQCSSSYDPEKSRAENLPVSWHIGPDGFVVEGEVIEVERDILRLINTIKGFGDKAVRLSEIGYRLNGNRYLESKDYGKFITWANMVIHGINELAPVIVIDNGGRPGRRDSTTTYTFNVTSDWAALDAVEPGELFIPKPRRH